MGENMTQNKLLSIDIGITGGYSIFDNNNLILYKNNPTIKVTKNKKTRKQFNVNVFAQIIRDNNISHVVFEQVSSRPGEGTVSAFNFGSQYGSLIGICEGLQLQYTIIHPKKWKNYYTNFKGLDKKQQKDMAIKMVEDMYNVKLKKSEHGIADAILLGHYHLNS